jgi:hypothetical protein
MLHRKRRALKMLADAGQRGNADPFFIARFTPELLELVRDGLVRAERDTMIGRGQTVEAVRIMITDAGRRMLAG